MQVVVSTGTRSRDTHGPRERQLLPSALGVRCVSYCTVSHPSKRKTGNNSCSILHRLTLLAAPHDLANFEDQVETLSTDQRDH